MSCDVIKPYNVHPNINIKFYNSESYKFNTKYLPPITDIFYYTFLRIILVTQIPQCTYDSINAIMRKSSLAF